MPRESKCNTVGRGLKSILSNLPIIGGLIKGKTVQMKIYIMLESSFMLAGGVTAMMLKLWSPDMQDDTLTKISKITGPMAGGMFAGTTALELGHLFYGYIKGKDARVNGMSRESKCNTVGRGLKSILSNLPIVGGLIKGKTVQMKIYMMLKSNFMLAGGVTAMMLKLWSPDMQDDTLTEIPKNTGSMAGGLFAGATVIELGHLFYGCIKGKDARVNETNDLSAPLAATGGAPDGYDAFNTT